MTSIYSLVPVNDANSTLTTINTNIDGLETAVGTPADVANAAGSLLARLGAIAALVDGLEAAIGTTGDAASSTGSLLARLGAIAGFVDQLEGFTDGIESVLGTAAATPAANTINANLLRAVRAASGASRTVTPPSAQTTVPISTEGAAATLASETTAVDWRRVSIYNNGTVPVFICLGGNATTSLYSFPLPPGNFAIPETLGLVTAISSGAATTVLVTVES
ncbi:hypothetical protein NG798_09355 [Ancylothrix sp. C2]|uniref:hypothetical protein n=1 Tax=Ancylothrix sp. D3o TaxID=2953691 RepID=UPI0021BBA4EF|nr:hypothetical protein [Ancylothrix sp. D3o]MCT7949992.1 hypothetical protein [Ancylothrix sp. D3o]